MPRPKKLPKTKGQVRQPRPLNPKQKIRITMRPIDRVRLRELQFLKYVIAHTLHFNGRGPDLFKFSRNCACTYDEIVDMVNECKFLELRKNETEQREMWSVELSDLIVDNLPRPLVSRRPIVKAKKKPSSARGAKAN